MTLRFDHAVIATRDLDAAVETYRQLGFALEPGGRHTGKGTRNALIRFPSDYLELIAIDDRDEALAAGPSRAALVRYLDERPAGLSTFALRTAVSVELDGIVHAWRAAGVDTSGPAPAQRIRPDGTILRWRTAVPGGSSVRRPWPFVIDWPDGMLPDAPAAGAHPNGALGVAEVAVADGSLELFEVYDDLGLPAVRRPDVVELGAGRAIVSLPGAEIDLLVAHPDGPLAARVQKEGPGPMQVGILVRDLSALAAFLADRGMPTTPAWPSGLRLAHPDPVAAPIVFLPPDAAPAADATRTGGPA